MKKAQSITETLKKGKALQKERETENNWNKIDEVLERISEINKKEEAQAAVELVQLMCIGIQSNRSKLSGSGCKSLSKIFEILGNEMKEHLSFILPCLLSALGKTNKVIFMRALGTAGMIASTCSLKSISKHIRANIGSQNKSVRLGLLEMAVKGIEKERIKDLVEVLEISVNDVNPDIRAKARDGMSKLFNMDRKTLIDLSKSLPEKGKEMASDKEETFLNSRQELGAKISPSVISNVCAASPKTGTVKIKDSGANVIVRGPTRMLFMNLADESAARYPLKPGHSLERIGHRLELHKKEIEEGLKKEWTPRKTPIIKKRQRQSTGTPVDACKNTKYTEENKNEYLENNSFNISEEIGNLSIARTEEDTEHIVENKDMYDSIFSSREVKGTKEFIKSCEVLAAEPASDSEYSILSPEVLIRRSTTKKI